MRPQIFFWPGGSIPTHDGEVQVNPWTIAQHIDQARKFILESCKAEIRPTLAFHLQSTSPRIVPLGEKA